MRHTTTVMGDDAGAGSANTLVAVMLVVVIAGLAVVASGLLRERSVADRELSTYTNAESSVSMAYVALKAASTAAVRIGNVESDTAEEVLPQAAERISGASAEALKELDNAERIARELPDSQARRDYLDSIAASRKAAIAYRDAVKGLAPAGALVAQVDTLKRRHQTAVDSLDAAVRALSAQDFSVAETNGRAALDAANTQVRQLEDIQRTARSTGARVTAIEPALAIARLQVRSADAITRAARAGSGARWDQYNAAVGEYNATLGELGSYNGSVTAASDPRALIGDQITALQAAAQVHNEAQREHAAAAAALKNEVQALSPTPSR